VPGEITYVDTSALVKLVIEEPESAALERFLAAGPPVTSSLIAAVELSRAARRFSMAPIVQARAREVLARLSLIAFDTAVAERAARVGPPALRSLDAIHLATALSLGADLDSFVAYDDRLVAAARRAGVRVVSPV
jgi:predicted nucleic acid-binding protein